MRHVIPFITVLLLLSHSASGQVRMGIEGVWNASVLSKTESIQGPSAGLLVHWKLSEDHPVYIQGGVRYSWLTGSRDTDGRFTKYETYAPTLSFPVMVGYEMCGGRVRLGGGAELGHVLSQTLSYALAGLHTYTLDEPATTEIRDFNPGRSRLLAGIEYMALPFMGLKATYCCGIPFSNGSYVADSADYVSQHNYVQLGLTLYLL